MNELKNHIKENKAAILVAAVILILLTCSFVFTGGAQTEPTAISSPSGSTVSAPVSATQQTLLTTVSAKTTVSSATAATSLSGTSVTALPSSTTVSSVPALKQTTPTATVTDRYHTDPVPDDKPKPVEPQDAVTKESVYTCTVSISCATVLQNMERCDPNKRELIPADGWILAPVTVSFEEGESVFDMLLRVCRENGIHMEYSEAPLYNSAYIKGIQNLYEFDVGPLSGWMYEVNGWFPNYGCSRYPLCDGDTVRLVYSCDYGQDVGGSNAASE
ncbi:MAG: DUF4430 domain-containing protein [Acutalibacteraceae bacterium]